MPTIDNRVVRMTFDSSRFDKAIQSTLKLVETFEKALSFKNAETGFQRLQIALDSLSGKKASDELNSINDSIDDIDGTKAAKQMESVQQSIDSLDSKSATDSLQAVQDSMDNVDSKNVSDQISAVNDAVDDADPTPFQNMIAGMQSASDNFNLNGVVDAVDDLTVELPNRFGALGTVIQGALFGLGGDIKDKIIGVFNGITHAITDPINDGLQEYQTQMGAIQTIIANTGRDFNSTADIAEVNAGLDELNQYADKTIYNFTEMTKNIGTFTAAGISMEDAIPAIQGVANIAALSGSNSQQASNAMYQLSQALSTGTLKLQDWNSVVNAGMGGQIFQDALLRTAYHVHEANGELDNFQATLDGIADGSISFRDSLEYEWATADVLSQTLQQMAIEYNEVGDAKYEAAKASLLSQGYNEEEANEILRLAKVAQDSATKVRTWNQLIDTTKEALGSGWTETWRIIIGDFKDATNLFTELSNEINGIIGALDAGRNGVLQSWFDWGGRDALFGIYEETESGLSELMEKGVLQHVIDAIKGWATPISDAFNEVFGIFSDNFDKDYADVILEFGATSEEAATQYEHTLSTVYDNVKNNSEEYKKAVEEYTKELDEIAKSEGVESKAYQDKQAEMQAALDGIVKNTDEYQDAVKRLDTTFENAKYGEDYNAQVDRVNEATDKLAEYEKSVLDPVIAEFGEDSEEYKQAVANMEASDEYKALQASLTEAENGLKAVEENYNNLSEAFDISTGVMDWVGQDLSALTQGLKDFAATLVPSEDAMIGIKGAFEGIFAVVDLVVHAFVDLLGIAGGVISFIRIFTDPVFDFALELLGAFGQIILAVHDALLTIKNSIVAAFNAFNTAIFGSSNAIEVIRDIYHGFLQWLDIPGKLQLFVDFIRDIIGFISGSIATAIGHVAEFGERVSATIEAIKKIFAENEGVQKFMEAFGRLGEKLSSIWDTITFAVGRFAAILFGSKEEIEETEQAVEPFQSVVDIFSSLADFIGKAADAFGAFVDAIPIDLINGFIFGAITNLGNVFVSIRDAIGGTVESVTNSVDIFGILSSIWDGIVSVGGSLFGVLESIGSVIWNVVSGAFGTLVDLLSPILESFGLLHPEVEKTEEAVKGANEQIDPMTEALKTLGDILGFVTGTLVKGFFGGIKLVGQILQWLLFVVGAVVGGFIYFLDIPGKVAAGIDLIGKAFNGLKDFVAPAVDGVLDFVRKITDLFGVTGQIQGFIDAIREFFGINKEGFEGSNEQIDGMAQAMQFFTNIQEQAIALWGEITRVAGEIKDAVLGFEPIQNIIGFATALRDDIASIPERIPLVDESGNIIVFTEAMKMFTDAFDYLSTLTPEKLFNDIITQVDNFIGWIWETGNNLVNAVQSPKNLINGILGFVQNAATKIEEFFPRVGGILSNGIQGIIDSANVLFSDGSFDSWVDFGGKIIDWFKNLPNQISEGFNNFVTSLQNGENDLPPHMKAIGQHIGDFLNTITSFDIKGAFDNIVNGIKGIPDTIAGIAERIKNAFLGVKEDTEESSNAISGVNPTAGGNGVAGVLTSAEDTEENVDIFSAIMQTISDKIRAIGEFIQNIPSTIAEAIPKIARTIGDAINAVLDYINDEMIGRLTSIFFKVAGCLAAWNALKLEKGIASFLTGAGNLMNHMAGVEQEEGIVAKFKDVMISLAIGLGSIALVVAVFSFIKPEDLDKAIVGVVKIMGALTVFYLLASVIDKFVGVSDNLGDSMLKAAASISVMGIGFVVITHVIDYLSGWVIEKMADIPKTLAGIAGLLVLSGLIAVLMAALSVGGKHALQAAAAMIVVSGALFALTKVLDILADFVVNKDLVQLGLIAVSLKALCVAMILLGVALKLVGEHGIGAAIAMLGLGAAIVMIADSVAKMAAIDYDQLTLVSQALVVLIGEFVGVVALAGKVNMFGVAAGFLAFGAAILLIGNSFEMLGTIKYDQLALIGQIMIVLVAEFGIIAKTVQSMDLIKTGAALLEFGVSLVAMSYSLTMLANIPVDQLGMAALALAGLVAVFGLITRLTQEGDILASGAAMVAFGVSLVGMSYAMQSLATIDVDQLYGIAIALGGLTLAFGLITAFTQEVDIAATALALIGFAGSLVIMSYAIQSLATVDIEQINGIALAFGALVAVFGVFSLILAAIPGSAVVVLALGAAMIEVGIAATLLAEAFQKATMTLPLFIAQIPMLSAAFGDITSHLVDYLGAAAGLVVAGAALGVFSVALGAFGVAAIAAGAGALLLADGIKALMSVFGGEAGDMESAGGNLMDGLINGITNGARMLPQVILGIGKAILEGFLSFFGIHSPSTVMDELVGQNIDLGIADGIMGGMPGIGDSLFSGLGDMLSNIPGWLTENAPAIQDWFFNTAIPAVGEWIGMAWDAVCNFFNENWPKFTDWLFNVAIPAFQDWFFNTAIPGLWELICNAFDSIVAFVGENWPKFVDWLMNVALPGLADWFFNTAIPGLWSWICSTFDSIVSFIGENAPKVVDWLFNTAIPGLGDWFLNTALPAIGEWIGNIFKGILDWLGEKKDDVGDWLHNTALPGLVSWAESIPGNIINGIGDIAQQFITTGENIANGIKQGVLNGVDWICNAITSLGASALDAIKGFFHIASPSKVMEEEVGENIAAGMEVGILNYTDKIKDAGTRLGETLGESIGEGVRNGVEASTAEAGNDAITTIGALRKKMNDAEKKYKKAEQNQQRAQAEYNEYNRTFVNDPEFIAFTRELDSMGLSEQEWVDRVNNSRWVQRANELYRRAHDNTEINNAYDAYQNAKKNYELVALLGNDNTRIDTRTWTVVPEAGSGPSRVVKNNGRTTTGIHVNPNTTSSSASTISQEAEKAIVKTIESVNNTLKSMTSYTKQTNAVLGDMQDQIQQINSNLYNMKIYMDTGNLVGAIAPQMDEALGFRQIQAGRGTIG